MRLPLFAHSGPARRVAVPPPAGGAGGLAAWNTGAVGAWIQISGTALSSVEPASPPAGTASSKLTAWCSFAIDTRDSSIYSAAGGGHGDYSGNEVDRVRLDDSAPAWTELRGPTATVQQTVAYYSDGRPTSRHSYYGVSINEADNRIELVGGSGYGGTPTLLQTMDSFNLTTNDYVAAGTRPNLPGVMNFEVRAQCRDPRNNDIFVFANFNVAKWTRSTNTWSTPVGDSSAPYAQGSASAFDSTRNRFFIVGDTACWTFDPATGVGTNRTMTGTDLSAVDYMGMVYDPVGDRYLARDAGSGGTVYEINPTTFACSAMSTSGGGSIPATTNGPFNKFLYVPNQKGVAYVPSYTGNVWFMRTS